MFKEVFNHIDFAIFPCISLVLFTVFLTSVVIWVWRPGSRSRYRNLAQLPFSDS